MKGGKGVLIGIGIAVLAAYALRKGGNFLSSQFGVNRAKVKVQNFRLGPPPTLDMAITLEVYNRLSVAVPFNFFSGVLKYGEVVLANVQTSLVKQIPANGTANIDATATVNLFQLGADAVAIYQSGQLLRSLRLDGVADLNGVRVPVNYPLVVV